MVCCVTLQIFICHIFLSPFCTQWRQPFTLLHFTVHLALLVPKEIYTLEFYPEA